MIIAFYKSTPKGIKGLYNRLVRWWCRGTYSHCEILFSDGLCASSSFMDGGVRFKQINLNPHHWDFIRVPDWLERDARVWFATYEGCKYDVLGNLHFVVGLVADDKRKWFCSEAVAAALGVTEPWRFDPNSLAALLHSIMIRKD